LVFGCLAAFTQTKGFSIDFVCTLVSVAGLYGQVVGLETKDGLIVIDNCIASVDLHDSTDQVLSQV